MSHSKLGCVYISVKDINRSIEFYGFLLQKEVEVSFKDRWAQFKITDDFRLGLLNPAFDKKIIKDRQDLDEHFDKNYIKNFSSKVRVGNSIILNLQTDDLNVEHQSLSAKYKEISLSYNYTYFYNYFQEVRMFILKEIDELYEKFASNVYKPNILDGKTKELIALSNSVMADCVPCIEYHYRMAVKAGA